MKSNPPLATIIFIANDERFKQKNKKAASYFVRK
jgi:hypothetical protein